MAVPPGCFAVDAVEPQTVRLPSDTLAYTFARRYTRKVEVMPHADQRVVRDALSSTNPLIDAVHTAFSQHYPLTITPDAIWITIAQGFSHHLRQNSEAFRERLVSHQGKPELVQQIGLLSLDAFRAGIAGLSAQIKDASDPVLHETLVCNFSTTSPDIRLASEVVLLDSYSHYFQYRMRGCICGIPWIRIEGTVADWERIAARAEVLGTFELEWWIRRLRPILAEFTETARGNPNPEFWAAIYKPRSAYTTTAVTGWIADLFPYLGQSADKQPSHIFGDERANWVVSGTDSSARSTGGINPDGHKGVATNSFPIGLSRVPFKLEIQDVGTFDRDLLGGLLAVEQLPDLSLAPVINWCVAEQKAPPPPPDLSDSDYF